MSGDKNAAGKPSLPDDIASEAGLPRAEDIGHTLHDIDERARRDAKAGLRSARDETNAALGETRQSAETAAHEATEAASDLRDDASDAAQSVRDRVHASAADARDRADDAYDDVRSWASDRYDMQRVRAADLADRGHRRLRESRTTAEDFVSENPLLVGVVGLAAGLLLGALLPRTRHENEALGPYADELRDQGLRYARDVTQQGRAFVERALDPDNLDAAVERANDPKSGRQGGYEGPERTAHRL